MTLSWGIRVVTHVFKSAERTTPWVDPEVNRGLRATAVGQRGFTTCEKCITRAGDVDSRRGRACGARGHVTSLDPLLNFPEDLKLL